MKAIFFSIYAQQFGSLLIAIFGLLHFGKRETGIKLLGLYGLNSFIFQFLQDFLMKIHISNNTTGDFYVFTESLTLLCFFYWSFKNRIAKKLTLGLAVIYICLFFVFTYQHLGEVIGSIRTMRDLMMLLCALIYFYFLITDMPANQITKFPMFWIMTAFLVFFAGTFVLSLSLDFLVNVLKDDLAFVWTARNFFRFFFCLVVSYGLWMDLRLVKIKQAFA